ncbi:DUF1015 domain-containing protein [Butyrivibrio sp. MC2013]|uniref:DUF1015 domain-containing protein n=1 Tax=Butyrivibrio sp. MC2013 TaxID=1280686 RepID=UPI00041303E0|nr:DUF1015 family protein [Butyrivibrio sp. MC2013]
MAKIRPFMAYRPKPELVEQCADLPYDVFDSAEARKRVEENPMSFLAIDRPETAFEEGHDMYAPEVYEKAREILDQRIEDGTYVCDSVPCYYIYQQTMNGRTQTGIAACASVDDYMNSVIKKHENTLARKEEDRIRHVDACDAHTGPIFLGYRSNNKISKIVDKVRYGSFPVYEFRSADGTDNKVWVCADQGDVDEISRAFSEIDSIYIADGHHRCASAVKVGLARRAQDPEPTGEKEYDYFLAVLFPEDELMIMDYNRVVRDLGDYDSEGFITALSASYEVEKVVSSPFKPSKKYETGMLLDGSWYKLTARDEVRSDDPVDGLDVSILQNEVLDKILGIKDPKTDPRIDFVGGIRGLEELERRCRLDGRVAFAMYPTSVEELFNVADAGRLMPPKSTWFEPKLLSGLFIHKLK